MKKTIDKVKVAAHVSGMLAELEGPVDMDRYDAGLLSDFGGGNVEWWQDYIRAELDRSNDFYQAQRAAPVLADLTDEQKAAPELLAALQSLVAEHGGTIGAGHDHPISIAARAAIDAAKGQS